MFSKLWYVAQVVKLNDKKLNEMLKAAMKFLYSGENERPVRSLNFRSTDRGGLGLIDPSVKASALLTRNMIKQYRNHLGNGIKIYGNERQMKEIIDKMGVNVTQCKDIYNEMIKSKTEKNGSLIPSRNEARMKGVKWSATWKNLNKLQGLSAKEKEFAWKLTQDLLPIGKRIHRANVDKRCLNEIGDQVCQVIPDLKHKLLECPANTLIGNNLKGELSQLLGREVDNVKLLGLSFNHKDKRKLKVLVWFAIKVLYIMYCKLNDNKSQLLTLIVKEINWNLDMQIKIGSATEMLKLRNHLVNVIC